MNVNVSVRDDGRPSFDLDLEPGTHAFVDGDRIVGGYTGPVPAIRVRTRDAQEATRICAEALVDAAEEIERRVREGLERRPGRVEVTGRGALAQLVRARVTARPSQGSHGSDGSDGAVSVIVETTGDPERLLAALSDVAELGTVVLAGEPLDRETLVDTYTDMHRRGLVVVGVPEVQGDLEVGVDAAVTEPTLAPPSVVPPGGQAAAGALWYHLRVA